MLYMKTGLLKLLVPVAGVCAGYHANAQATLYSTITGKVWQENTANGMLDPGEAGLTGTLVELHKVQASADTIVSAAVTDPSGQYVLENYRGTGQFYILYRFPNAGYTITSRRAGTNDTLNSAAYSVGAASANRGVSDTFNIIDNTTIRKYNLGLVVRAQRRTFCNSTAFASTTWSQTINLPKADPGIGSLGSAVLFTGEAVKHPSFGIENTNPNNPVTASLEFAGRLKVDGDVLPQSIELNTQITKSESLPLYDGVLDYAGTSGKMWSNEFSSASSSYTESDASAYAGSGTLQFPVTAQSVSTVIGGGNMQNYVTTNVAAGLCVTYIYTTILPVSLTSFDAAKAEGKVQLQWITASEINNKGFAIERSANGKDFTEIGFVASQARYNRHMGTLTYNFRDEQPLSGRNAYRLKQVDNDGKATYSMIRVIDFSAHAEVTVYPNPANEKTVVLNAAPGSRVEVRSSTGRVVEVITGTASGSLEIDTRALPNGIYFLHISGNGNLEVRKLMVAH